MDTSIMFFINSILLGCGLAMDAFTVSLANGLNEPDMSYKKMSGIAGVFAVFQWLMPMIGWICVHTIVMLFLSFERIVPWIAMILLLFLGLRMIIEAIKKHVDENNTTAVTPNLLLIQGIATSIDALSVGFTIEKYGPISALICSLIIGCVTFIICFSGLCIGKRFGTKMSRMASVTGGVILIAIGLEIFITGII